MLPVEIVVWASINAEQPSTQSITKSIFRIVSEQERPAQKRGDLASNNMFTFLCKASLISFANRCTANHREAKKSRIVGSKSDETAAYELTIRLIIRNHELYCLLAIESSRDPE